MCWKCFERYGDAPVINDRVLSVYRKIRVRGDDAHYSPLLHIMVADMNLEDHWFDLSDASDSTRQRYDAAEQWERDIFDGLAALSEAERGTALAIEWGYVNEQGELRQDLLVQH